MRRVADARADRCPLVLIPDLDPHRPAAAADPQLDRAMTVNDRVVHQLGHDRLVSATDLPGIPELLEHDLVERVECSSAPAPPRST
jgi:hypothetical protein